MFVQGLGFIGFKGFKGFKGFRVWGLGLKPGNRRPQTPLVPLNES